MSGDVKRIAVVRPIRITRTAVRDFIFKLQSELLFSPGLDEAG
jgi:hypothetical protein